MAWHAVAGLPGSLLQPTPTRDLPHEPGEHDRPQAEDQDGRDRAALFVGMSHAGGSRRARSRALRSPSLCRSWHCRRRGRHTCFARWYRGPGVLGWWNRWSLEFCRRQCRGEPQLPAGPDLVRVAQTHAVRLLATLVELIDLAVPLSLTQLLVRDLPQGVAALDDVRLLRLAYRWLVRCQRVGG